jgi:hypothetical protein
LTASSPCTCEVKLFFIIGLGSNVTVLGVVFVVGFHNIFYIPLSVYS